MIKMINKTTTEDSFLPHCEPTDTCGFCQGICWVIPSLPEMEK